MSTEIRVPPLPESVSDGTLSAWHKTPGDAVQRGENLADLETDKVVLEIPAPVSGTLTEIMRQPGDTVTSGELLAMLAEGDVAEASSSPSASQEAAPSSEATVSGSDLKGVGPAARKLISENQLDPSAITGTGRQGQITKGDVLQHLEKAPQPSTPQSASTPPPSPTPTHPPLLHDHPRRHPPAGPRLPH